MKLIIAADPNGGIGYQNKLPWINIQGDLARFKQLTDGQLVIMGRNTWESLPIKPLPNRKNVVITSTLLNPITKNVLVTPFINAINDDAWIIGGAKLVNSNWDKITEVHLTKTFNEYTCDAFIDLTNLETNFTCKHEDVFNDHTYQIWKRK